MAKKPVEEEKPEIEEEKPDVEVVAEPEKPAVVEPEDGIEQLKANLAKAQEEGERLKADAATQRARADKAAADLSAAQGQVRRSEIQSVDDAITLKQTEIGTLKAQLIEANTNGDWTAAADLQEKIGISTSEMVQLRAGKTRMEQQKNAPVPQQQAKDPATEWATILDGQGFGRSAQWVRNHPEWARDPGKLRQLTAAAQLAESEGKLVDSDDYFSRVESLIGVARPEPKPNGHDEPALSEASPGQTRKSDTAPAAAPPSRGGGASGSPNRTRIRLTPEQAEAAKISGMTYEQYYNEVVKIQNEAKVH